MSIQPDSWIKKMCMEQKMIDPFIDKLEKKKCTFLWSIVVWI